MRSYLAISYFMFLMSVRTIVPASLVHNTLQIVSVSQRERVHRATHIGRCTATV